MSNENRVIATVNASQSPQMFSLSGTKYIFCKCHHLSACGEICFEVMNISIY